MGKRTWTLAQVGSVKFEVTKPRLELGGKPVVRRVKRRRRRRSVRR